MSERQADVLNFFATPVVVAELPEPEALNRALAELILAREAASREPGEEGPWQSEPDLEEWGGDAAAHVLRLARQLADRLTCDRMGVPVETDWRVSAWAGVTRKGESAEFHTHPGSFWAGAYHVDDGGADEASGGELEIQDPRGIAPALYTPLLAMAVPGGRSAGASELLRPRTGQMLLWPSWLSHAVRPYRGEGTRIVLGFTLAL